MSEAVALANITVIAMDGAGIAIEGPPGSGKSSLALELLERGARLVGDDGIILERKDETLVASPPEATRGLIEVRNVGIVKVDPVSAPLALAIRLDADAARLPSGDATREWLGISLPRFDLFPEPATTALRTLWALRLVQGCQPGRSFREQG